jgi:hypothetical protein
VAVAVTGARPSWLVVLMASLLVLEGWSLFGLNAALNTLGSTSDAAAVEKQFRSAWKRSGVALTASAL